jgi:hypothetical protein
MTGRIELKTSDLYHKNKRNLMLLCSAVIVVALAGPGPQIKIPGFGEDVKLSTPMAFAVAMLAVAYFFWQFFVDWRTARALNSESLTDGQSANLDMSIGFMFDAISSTGADVVGQLRAVSSVTGTFSHLRQIMDVDVDGASGNVVELWQGLHGKEHLGESGNLAEIALRQNFVAEVLDQFKRLRHELSRLETQMIEIQANITPVLSDIGKHIGEISQNTQTLVHQHRTLSKAISGTQRANFWLDIGICSALSLVSLIATIIIVVRPGWTWLCNVI